MKNNERQKAIVHYICSSVPQDKLGATKLNKVLWYIDVSSYLEKGHAMTGFKYKKLQHGPVPANIISVIKDLQSERKLSISEGVHYGYSKKDYISLIDADLTYLEKEEIDRIHFITDIICDQHTASSVSKMSHDIVWESASMGEEIPFSAILASVPAEITDRDREWADERIRGIA